jgi:hypothetical protein
MSTSPPSVFELEARPLARPGGHTLLALPAGAVHLELAAASGEDDLVRDSRNLIHDTQKLIVGDRKGFGWRSASALRYDPSDFAVVRVGYHQLGLAGIRRID